MIFTHSFYVPMKWACRTECVSIVMLLFQKYLKDFDEVFFKAYIKLVQKI